MTYLEVSELLLLAPCLFALLCGGAPERITAALFILANILSLAFISPFQHRFHAVEIGVLIVDLGLFIALLALMLVASRFWPMWMAALQGLTVLSHILGLFPYRPLALVYAILSQIWFPPMALLLAVATWRHLRRVAKGHADPAWRSPDERAQPD